jgi:hypothetical protein
MKMQLPDAGIHHMVDVACGFMQASLLSPVHYFCFDVGLLQFECS